LLNNGSYLILRFAAETQMVEPGVYLEHFVDGAREYLRDASKANYLAVLSANQTNDRIFTDAVDPGYAAAHCVEVSFL
ncbi:hypothetical protein DJ537_25140, partial [Enterobacter hormaechei]